MGDVYLAERADQQFQMRVAIKLIKRGMDTDSVLRRFQHERQILASLEHPNIARLLDGGTTEDGLPYFVMEYIKGDRIDQYANAHRLSIQDRLELFRQVCGAVSYAHQRLVVHRDLKPSNILVTPAGVPKLLDFGIAKIIESNELAAATLVTITAPLMTPEYASPEQIEGTPTTTLSDVYSLGAVLYELLSGRPPHHLKTRTPQQIAHAITRGDIAKPSTVVTRPEDATRLRGDLDKIVLMALRKEASRRYQSVEQFSEDIRRHLVGRPVIARPDTLSYRAAKFAQRNKLGISAAALLLLSLLGGIIATTWQARRATMQGQRARTEQARAERRFNEVRKLANSVLFDYHDAINALPGATKVRERLVKDALTYLDSLAGEAHGDADLQRELGAAYERVGDVRGGIWSGNLGDTAGAMDSYIKALRIRETLVAMNSSDAQARGDLASSHKKLGTLLLQNDEADSGLAHLQKAFTLSLDLAREQPANDDLQLELARIRNRLGDAMTDRGEPVVALEQHQAALTICEKLVASHPRDQRYRRALLLTHGFISDALRSQNDEAGAIAARSKALALGEELLAEDPVNAEYRRLLVLSHQNAGDYREKSDKRGALEHFRRALTLNEELFAADPANALVRKDLAHSHRRVADLLAEMEDNSQALLHFRKSLETYEGVVADAPADFT
ncbi:MAG TPA: protein kinase, partial [Chthoniobacterales bacterium]|nr:protein kinase [Chthoniobacterales bacterium]